MIDQPQFFVGRINELKQMTNLMTGAQPTSINLVGERKLGKSSLLYQFFLRAESLVQAGGGKANRYAVVYLSLQDGRCRKEADLYRAIAQELVRHPVARRYEVLRTALQGAFDRQRFSAAMDVWKAQGFLPVLCLDGFEELIENTAEFDAYFYDNLRALTDRSAVMLVMASRQPLEVYRDKISSLNTGQVLLLERLSEQEAQALVELPRQQAAGTPGLEAVDQQVALQWGKRHPYLLQFAGRCLWEATTEPNQNRAQARRKFDQEARRLQESLRGTAPQSRWAPLRWLWNFPLWVGRTATWIGNNLDDVGNRLIGMAIILIAVLAIFKLVPWDQLKQFLPLEN